MNLRYRLLSVVILIFLGMSASQAQEMEVDTALSRIYLQEAKIIAAETKVLTQARDIFKLSADYDPNNVEANYRTGELFLETTQKAEAVPYLLKTYKNDPNYKFNLLFMIGQAYQFAYEFETAIDYYKQYLKKLEDKSGYKGADKTPKSFVERKIYECENGIRYKANPINYSIVNLGRKINSESWDYGPSINAEETIMIFTTRRQDGNLNDNVFDDNFFYEDIFISKKVNGDWSYAKNIGNVVNTKYHDSNLGFSPDGKTLYIYSDEGNGDIYYTNLLSEDTWSIPESLSENINSSGYNEKSVSQSADGSILLFASNRPGGYGGFDIYYSIKNKKDEWGPSKNIGDIINTDMDEDGCFLQFDGKTLYFSSTGHDGMGGFDIYKTEYDSAGGVWSTPENLGYPLNTPDDDIYFVMSKDGKTGYYASVREDGMGYNDIYRVTIADASGGVNKKEVAVKENSVDNEEKETKKEVKEVEVKEPVKEVEKAKAPVTLQVRVIDAKTNEVIEARIELKRQGDNLVVPVDSKKDGIYNYVILADQPQEYMLSAQKEGYIFVNKKVRIPAAAEQPRTVRESLSMKQPEAGSTKVLRNIFFDFGKASFTDGSYDELNKLVAFMKQNKDVAVEIAGHTDNIGTSAYNKKLSQLRANRVVAYLTDKGIDRRRLTAVGYGETRPIVSNDDEVMGREINRRVEFIVKE